jgi:hypothetical protein
MVLFVIALMHLQTGLADEWTIDRLMAEMTQKTSSHAHFIEIKYISMLERPLESSGELFYTAPDRLEKRTLTPKPESMILDRDTLVLERGLRKRRVPLTEYPELGAFVESIRATLAGDRQALESNYELCLSGTFEHWILELRPLTERMQAFVTSIRIAGDGDAVSSIEINLADGDSSLMMITPSTP